MDWRVIRGGESDDDITWPDYITLCNILWNLFSSLYLTFYCYDSHSKFDCSCRVIGGGQSDNDINSCVIWRIMQHCMTLYLLANLRASIFVMKLSALSHIHVFENFYPGLSRNLGAIHNFLDGQSHWLLSTWGQWTQYSLLIRRFEFFMYLCSGYLVFSRLRAISCTVYWWWRPDDTKQTCNGFMAQIIFPFVTPNAVPMPVANNRQQNGLLSPQEKHSSRQWDYPTLQDGTMNELSHDPKW